MVSIREITDEHRTTIIFLVDGRFRIDLSDKREPLKKEGGYLMWGEATTISGVPKRTP